MEEKDVYRHAKICCFKKKKLLIAKRVNFANQSRVVNFAIMLSFPDENVV